MRKDGGLYWWPTPIVQLDKGSLEGGQNVLVIKTCGYCDCLFQFNDITVTSCRHVFYPFCLGVMVKSSNKCLDCKEDLHPNWWSSWRFSKLNHRLTKLATDLEVEEARKRAIANIRDAAKLFVKNDTIQNNMKCPM